MKTIKDINRVMLIAIFYAAILSTSTVSAQILRVDSVTVNDTIWNSDSLWPYPLNHVQSRDCKISFTLKGEGMAKIFIKMSVDSGKTWISSLDSLYMLYNSPSAFFNQYGNTFITGQRATITVRVRGGDRPSLLFKLTAHQAAPMIAGNPKISVFCGITTPTPGKNIDAILNVKEMDTSDTSGFCTLAKVYWDTLGNGSVADSTMGTDVLTWTWHTQVPAGVSGQRRKVIVRSVDKNGLWSAPETLGVQFGLQRKIVMKNIPAGTFTMGSDSSVDKGAFPPHQVTLSTFKMQETAVTQEQYLAVLGHNPSLFQTGDSALLRPMEEVSWYDAVLFCNALSKLSGLDTCYKYAQPGAADAVCDFAKNGYRLPTEAQYEYACRGGTTTEYWWGATTDGMDSCAWTWLNSGDTTHPVASKKSNAYGLYDMVGNVFQWCNDWYVAYTAAAAIDPTGPATGGSRVQRGGACIVIFNTDHYRSAYRFHPDFIPNDYLGYAGFRVALPN